MGNEPRVRPAEPSRMMDAEQRLHLSLRSDWQERLKIGPDWTPGAEMLDQGGNARRFKQAADRNLKIKGRSDTDAQTRRTPREPSHIRKDPINPNAPAPNHLRKYRTQQLLPRSARKPPNPGAILRRR